MNILYINHYAGSVSMGMEFRPFYFAREWKKMGHNVRIIGATFSHLRKVNPNVIKDFEIQNIDEIEYQWIKTKTYEGNGVSRAITMFEFCSKLWVNAKKIVNDFNPDVVISSSTYPLDTFPAQRIKKIAKCKYIHETHDLWPLTLVEIGGMNKNHPFVKLLGIAEKSAYKNSDHVVGVAPNEVEYMLEHGLQNENKFTCIQNGVVLEDWKNIEEMPLEHKKVFDKLHKENKFIVEYVGGHALSNDLDVLIETARLNKDNDDVAFVLIGKGVEKNRLINLANGLNNIFFLPPVSKKQVPAVLNEADVLYIGAAPCSLYRYGVSMNKVYDYMMSGKPIIYGVDAFNNDVEKFKCGITIAPQKPIEVIEAIKKYKQMTDVELKTIGNNGQDNVIKEYNYTKLSNDFLSIMYK